MLLRRSFVENQISKKMENRSRRINGQNAYHDEEEMRLEIEEEIAHLYISNSSFDKLKETAPIVVDHRKKKRGRIILDFDGTLTRNDIKENCTKLEMRIIRECFGIPEDVMMQAFMKLGKGRARTSKRYVETPRIAENIPIILNELKLLSNDWQDFNHSVFNGRYKESAAQSIFQFNQILGKNLYYYFHKNLIDLPVKLRKLGFDVYIASQNQHAWIADILEPFGFNDVVSNHIPYSSDDKIWFPDSSHPINMFTSANKHNGIKRLGNSVSKVFTEEDNLSIADFSHNSEIEGFRDSSYKEYQMPFFGIDKSWLVESDDLGGDVLHTVFGMFKDKEFETTFLFKENNAQFSLSTPLGQEANNLFEKENVRRVNVNDPDHIVNFLANTTLAFDQTIGVYGIEKYLDVDENEFVLENKKDEVKEKKKFIYESYRFMFERLNEERKKNNFPLMRYEKIFGERKIENPYIIKGISYRTPDTEVKVKILDGPSHESLQRVRKQTVLIEDLEGSIELRSMYKNKLRAMNVSDRRSFFNSETYQ